MSTMVFILLLFSILLGIPEASVLKNELPYKLFMGSDNSPHSYAPIGQLDGSEKVSGNFIQRIQGILDTTDKAGFIESIFTKNFDYVGCKKHLTATEFFNAFVSWYPRSFDGMVLGESRWQSAGNIVNFSTYHQKSRRTTFTISNTLVNLGNQGWRLSQSKMETCN